LLPAIQDFPIAYVLTWRNAHDKPGHFYAAWPESGDAADFKAFAESDNILMLNE
jgi:mannan endo-1,4-beta-mannosidase